MLYKKSLSIGANLKIQCTSGKKADANTYLNDLCYNAGVKKRSDDIFENLDRDFQPTYFLFLQSTNDDKDYHRPTAFIRINLNIVWFEMNTPKVMVPRKPIFSQSLSELSELIIVNFLSSLQMQPTTFSQI